MEQSAGRDERRTTIPSADAEEAGSQHFSSEGDETEESPEHQEGHSDSTPPEED